VFLGGIDVVGINRPNVHVAAVHATLRLPLVDDLLEPGTRTPQILCGLRLPANC
jgi:hypothetical protein